jgi:glucose-6-phosphate isomerase
MQIKFNNKAEELVQTGLSQLAAKDFTAKLYQHQANLWKTEEEHTKIINNSLGWTEVYNWTLEHLNEIKDFASSVKDTYKNVVLMGMGGSSLAPEVLRVLFGKKEGWPTLIVLDSTNPDWVSKVRAQIDPAKTLFIFASKSGGTVEPSSQFAYFYEEVAQAKVANPGDNFIAITDPGTGLENLAKEKKFRKIFLNKSDIGGRFSALSFFGMVPAALSGIDIEPILKSAKAFGDSVKNNTNKAPLELGALMGEGFLNKKDKLTLLMPREIDTFGLWIEQLVAESTGKENCGVVPVAGEGLYKDFAYQQDRIFVHINFNSQDNLRIKEISTGLEAKYPVAQVEMTNLNAIGEQFLLWEIATAACGAIMKINPFDQPNVQAAKTLAKGILEELSKGNKDPQAEAELLLSENLQGKVKKENIGKDILNLVKPNDYIALLAYLNETPQIDETLKNIREKLLTASKAAVLFGYGPRYLHSTGQLHKGDGGNGIFIILSAQPEQEVSIPKQPYTFGDLVSAQALADFKALSQKGRRVIKIHLSKPVLESLNKLSNLF